MTEESGKHGNSAEFEAAATKQAGANFTGCGEEHGSHLSPLGHLQRRVRTASALAQLAQQIVALSTTVAFAPCLAENCVYCSSLRFASESELRCCVDSSNLAVAGIEA
jgi:hypothetical protein